MGKRPDGYHELEMVNVSLDLHDTITVTPKATLSLDVRGGSEPLPMDSRNLVWRAAAALAAPGSHPPAVHITIDKRIPIGAGLAGGSTDAAAILRLMGEGRPDLSALALALGADIPFCLDGRPAIVRGIGERIFPIPITIPLHIVVANPGFSVSTREIFTALAANPISETSSAVDTSSSTNPPSAADELATALATSEPTTPAMLASKLSNDLQAVTTRLYPAVAALLDAVRASGAYLAQMSGSGPTVFGLYATAEEAKAGAERLAAHAPFVRRARVISNLQDAPDTPWSHGSTGAP